ncbi:MAG: hypothetical protein AAGA00_10315 [Pseudomonadota bacterium]
MGKLNLWATFLVCCCLIGSGPAHAQDEEDAPACWWEYANCSRQSFGDAQWRSVCYADFSHCIGTKKLPKCPATPTVSDCLSYKAECDALTGGDPALLADCSDDADACALAHGC